MAYTSCLRQVMGKNFLSPLYIRLHFDIFLLNNPFELKKDTVAITPTDYVRKLNKLGIKERDLYKQLGVDEPANKNDSLTVYTGKYEDTTKVYGDTVQIDFNNYVFGNSNYGGTPR